MIIRDGTARDTASCSTSSTRRSPGSSRAARPVSGAASRSRRSRARIERADAWAASGGLFVAETRRRAARHPRARRAPRVGRTARPARALRRGAGDLTPRTRARTSAARSSATRSPRPATRRPDLLRVDCWAGAPPLVAWYEDQGFVRRARSRYAAGTARYSHALYGLRCSAAFSLYESHLGGVPHRSPEESWSYALRAGRGDGCRPVGHRRACCIRLSGGGRRGAREPAARRRAATTSRHPAWGQAGRPYPRVAPAALRRRRSARRSAGPPARYVSNRIFNDIGQNVFSENARHPVGLGRGASSSTTLRAARRGRRRARADRVRPRRPAGGVHQRPRRDRRSPARPRRRAPASRGAPREQINTVSSYIDALGRLRRHATPRLRDGCATGPRQRLELLAPAATCRAPRPRRRRTAPAMALDGPRSTASPPRRWSPATCAPTRTSR